MAHLIEVAFRGNRKEFFQWEGEAPPPLRAAVIVEADRGEDLGRVHATGELAEVRCRGCAHGCGTAPPPRRALRLATRDDETRDRAHTADNEAARRAAMTRVRAHGLVMKLTDAEWQWDRRKLTIYFTSERRVDFRALVRELAAHFHTRIELKQIGVRDEARRLSGIGRCGREYCSASWMSELRPVNLGVAKDQRLSLNPQQISGACGRLMCCLRHEHEFYVQSRRRFPKEGKILRTSLGEEKVLACDIFNERVTLRGVEGDTRVVPLADLRAEIAAADGGDAGVPAPEQEPGHEQAHEQAAEPAVTTAEFRVGRPAEQGDAAVAEDTAEWHALPAAATEAAAGTETETAVTPAPEATAAPDEPPRKRRRRGRRGGRRLRAAEQRQAEGASDEGADDASDDAPDDASDEATEDGPDGHAH